MEYVGRYVYHRTFGKGKIIKIEYGIATVRFNAEEKRFILDDCINNGILQLLDITDFSEAQQVLIADHGIQKKLNYIDLFAGAGGLSEGFASTGYEAIAHVEMDANACHTLKTRQAYYFLKTTGDIDKYNQYIKGEISRETLYGLVPEEYLNSVICETMSSDTMPKIFKRIDQAMEHGNIQSVDLIIGGPPCQAYSIAGRGRKCMDSDPRNTLYKLYLQTLNRYKPAMFVFENVPGLLSAGNGEYLQAIKQGFIECGYEIEMQLLLASDYGVLQNRKRIIIVGWKKDTEFHYPDLKQLNSVIRDKYHVADILNDLPSIQAGGRASEYKGKDINSYLSWSGIRSDADILSQHEARPNLERDREIYRRVIQAWKKDGVRLRYTDLPEELMTHKNRKSYLDRFKVVADNLPACQTMVAHICKDGHYFIHPDINQARSLSVREAARVQSFPDNYYFEGGRTAAFKQIGNAVPPLLARQIAEALKIQFQEEAKNE